MTQNIYSITFPDGTIPTQRYKYQKANLLRTHSKIMPNTRKDKLPVLQLLSAENYKIISGDFDDLAKTRYDSWSELFMELDQVPNITVCRSPSGKVKIFGVAFFPNIKNEDIINILNSILPRNLRNTFDPKGTTQCFTTPDMFNEINRLIDEEIFLDVSEFLPHDALQDAEIIEDTSSIKLTWKPKPIYKYGMIDAAELPEFALAWSDGHERKLKFAQVMCYAYNLVEEFGLSQKCIAATIGATTGQVRNWLWNWRQLGLLVLTDRDYVQHKTSMKYRASGALLEVLVARKARHELKKQNDIINAKVTPKAGSYNKYWLYLVNMHADFESFKMALDYVSGIDDKLDRRKVALATARWHYAKVS